MKLKHSSQTPVPLASTMSWRLSPAQSRCPAGHTAGGSPEGQTNISFGSRRMVPPHAFLLHNVPCTRSPRISPVLLKIIINQDIFEPTGREKVQSQISNRLQTSFRVAEPSPGSQVTPEGQSHHSPLPDQHFTIWGAGLFLPPQSTDAPALGTNSFLPLQSQRNVLCPSSLVLGMEPLTARGWITPQTGHLSHLHLPAGDFCKNYKLWQEILPAFPQDERAWGLKVLNYRKNQKRKLQERKKYIIYVAK